MIRITFLKYNLFSNLIVNIESVLHNETSSLITATKHASKKPHKKVQIIVEPNQQTRSLRSKSKNYYFN